MTTDTEFNVISQYEFSISTNSKGQALPAIKVIATQNVYAIVARYYSDFRNEIIDYGIEIANENDEYEIKENAKLEGQLTVKGSGSYIIQDYLDARRHLKEKPTVMEVTN